MWRIQLRRAEGRLNPVMRIVPGGFEITLKPSEESVLTVSAESQSPPPVSGKQTTVSFEERLRGSMKAFVVDRGEGKTVVAGYPWFLDWGRDTFIAARGLLSAGWTKEVFGIVKAFARFEDRGSLPNVLNGENASNRGLPMLHCGLVRSVPNWLRLWERISLPKRWGMVGNCAKFLFQLGAVIAMARLMGFEWIWRVV